MIRGDRKSLHGGSAIHYYLVYLELVHRLVSSIIFIQNLNYLNFYEILIKLPTS